MRAVRTPIEHVVVLGSGWLALDKRGSHAQSLDEHNSEYDTEDDVELIVRIMRWWGVDMFPASLNVDAPEGWQFE